MLPLCAMHSPLYVQKCVSHQTPIHDEWRGSRAVSTHAKFYR